MIKNLKGFVEYQAEIAGEKIFLNVDWSFDIHVKIIEIIKATNRIDEEISELRKEVIRIKGDTT